MTDSEFIPQERGSAEDFRPGRDEVGLTFQDFPRHSMQRRSVGDMEAKAKELGDSAVRQT